MDGRNNDCPVLFLFKLIFAFLFYCFFYCFFPSMTITNLSVLQYLGQLVTGGSDLKQTSVQGKQVFGTCEVNQI